MKKLLIILFSLLAFAFYAVFIANGVELSGTKVFPNRGGTGTVENPDHLDILVGSSTNQVYQVISSSSFINQLNLATGDPITSLNGLSTSTQLFATSTASDTYTITSSGDTHTFTIPSNVGFFSNDSGYLTSVDISDDSNLSAINPIVLTDDQLSFSSSSDFNWTGNHSFAGYIDLLEMAEPSSPTNAGRLFAFDQNGETRVKFIDPDGVVTDISQDNTFVVRNTSGVAMDKGDVVYVTAQTGQVPEVGLAKSDSTTTLPAVAVLNEDVSDNGYGTGIKVGVVEDIDTSAFSVGDDVYVSPTTAGGFTNTRPPHPHLNQPVGRVLASGVGNGSIKVSIEFPQGDELGTIENIFKIGDNTDGVKTLTFDEDTADGSINWNGSSYFLNDGDVGIGTSTPATKLHNTGSSTLDGNLILSSLASGFLNVNSSGVISTSTVDISDDTNAGTTEGVLLSGDDFGFDCSQVTDTADDGISCSGENLVTAVGDSVDISSETNLSAINPIVLTGDELSFASSSDFNWTGVQVFNAASSSNVDFTLNGTEDELIFADVSENQVVIHGSSDPNYGSLFVQGRTAGGGADQDLVATLGEDDETIQLNGNNSGVVQNVQIQSGTWDSTNPVSPNHAVNFRIEGVPTTTANVTPDNLYSFLIQNRDSTQDIFSVNSDGNVGIATGTPSTKLQVVGSSTLQDTIFDGYLDIGIFADGSEPATQEGRMFYSEEEQTLSFYDVDDQEVNIGQDLVRRVKNTQGSAINKGDVVYVSGSSGENPEVKLARADDMSTTRSLGVMLKDVNNNGVAKAVVNGKIKGFDTSSFVAGDTLYLSTTTAGGYTTTTPSYPNFKVKIGTVIFSSATDGELNVNISREEDVFTQGSVLFADSDGRNSEDNTNLFWNDTSNRLGIGTTTPTTDLHIVTNTNNAGRFQNTNSRSNITVLDDDTTSVFGAEDGDVYIGEGVALNKGSAEMLINTNRVELPSGVDQQISNGGLCVDSDGSCSAPGAGGIRVGSTGFDSSNDANSIKFNTEDVSDVGRLVVGQSSSQNNLGKAPFEISDNGPSASSSMIFSDGGGGDSDFWIGRNENGNGVDDDSLEIGSSESPGTNAILDIPSSGSVQLENGRDLAFTKPGTNPGRINFGLIENDDEMLQGGGGAFRTLYNANSPGLEVDLDDNNTNNGARFTLTQNGTAYGQIADGVSGVESFLESNLSVNKTTDPNQALDVSGTIRQTNATSCSVDADADGDLVCTSDKRLKDVHGLYSGGLSEIEEIKPIVYNRKGEKYVHVGFSAQNVSSTLPHAVSKQPSGYLGLDRGAITALNTNAIKELKQKNEDLKSKVNNLESRIEDLEARH